MKRFLLTYFVWISLLVIASSCASPRIIMSGKADEGLSEITSSNSLEKTTYKTTVLFQGKELSGRVLVKKDVDGNYRIAFLMKWG